MRIWMGSVMLRSWRRAWIGRYALMDETTLRAGRIRKPPLRGWQAAIGKRSENQFRPPAKGSAERQPRTLSAPPYRLEVEAVPCEKGAAEMSVPDLSERLWPFVRTAPRPRSSAG